MAENSMDWLVTSQEDAKVLAEIRNASDRAVGIIGASLVEIHLTALIKQCCIEEKTDQDKAAMNEIFRSSGPLGSFASKIHFAYLSGMISQDLYSDLLTMRAIRNRFAHHIDIGSFLLPEISSRCFNFKIVDKYIVDSPNSVFGDVSAEFAIEISGAQLKLRNPKERYALSAQVFSVGLQGAAVKPKPYTPAF
jgi:DNA-binding MltR family transcriptional regulator